MENDSTPPPLANVGLHTNRTVTEIRSRRFKEAKKRVACSSDEELFVSRPQFKKMFDDQEIKQEGDEDLETDDQEMQQEEPIEPKDPRLANFMKGGSSIKWLNREFGNLNVDEALNGKPYDLSNFMDETCPQLKTRLLPRRGWQLLRRTLGRARRFSQTFIAEELKDQGLSPLCEPLPQEPKDSPSVEQLPYSNKLLESIMLVRKLLAMKKNALLEITLRNDEIEAHKDSRVWGSSQHRETKALYQRCFATLYCVNDEIVAPMTVLHEHLVQFRKEVAEKEARTCAPVQIYRQSLENAQLNLQLAERYKSLQLHHPDNKVLVLKLQTIMNIMEKLGGPHSGDLQSVVDCLFSQLSQDLPPELSAQLKKAMDELEPYRQRLKDLFKNVLKEEPTEDIH